MTVSEAGALIRILDRDLRLARLARAALVIILLMGIGAAIITPEHTGQMMWLWLGGTTAAVCWALLTWASFRQLQAANQASIFVANGRLDLAETQLRESLRAFTIHATAKLLACHNLAVVAHGRAEYAVAAELCDGILRRSSGHNRRATRTTRMLLADCRLWLNEVPAAQTALGELDVMDPELPLPERIMLLPIRIRCEVMSQQFDAAVKQLKEKVRLAELLESPRAALVHAMLSDACKALQRMAEATWLRQRAELYHDLTDLGGRYPGSLGPEAQIAPATLPGA